jgi:UDP-N-acetylmuramyl pentapeptide synthase
VFVVDNPSKAFGKIAHYFSLFIIPIPIGMTGTHGKTTVTILVANILKKNNKTIQTLGNYHNSLGLPLSIMKAEDDTEYFVLEMGARKIGDFRELTAIAKPNIVALLNVSSAHLDTFHAIKKK